MVSGTKDAITVFTTSKPPVDLRTVFCVRKVKDDLKTVFGVYTFTQGEVQTIFEVGTGLATNGNTDLSTVFNIHENVGVSDVKSIFTVNGLYFKILELKGTILYSDKGDKGKRSDGNKQIKVIIGDKIYV